MRSGKQYFAVLRHTAEKHKNVKAVTVQKLNILFLKVVSLFTTDSCLSKMSCMKEGRRNFLTDSISNSDGKSSSFQ